MIANAHLNEWRQTVPWADNKMVEQDLIISRLLVELFNHPKISDSLAFRGGTAIYKLFASHPVRYSEDIDLVQIKAEPIGETITAIRSIVDPMLGEPERKRSKKTFTLTYAILAEGESEPQKLKIEINTREHFSVYGLKHKDFSIKSRWFSGESKILSYEFDELLGTKIRAFYQRDKGRDLFDLWFASDGRHYEASSIVSWVLSNRGRAKSPLTQGKLFDILIFDFALYQEIREFFAEILKRDIKILNHLNDRGHSAALKYVTDYAQGVCQSDKAIIKLLRQGKKNQISIFALKESLPEQRVNLNIPENDTENDCDQTIFQYPIPAQIGSIIAGNSFFNVMQLLVQPAIAALDHGFFDATNKFLEVTICSPGLAFFITGTACFAEMAIGKWIASPEYMQGAHFALWGGIFTLPINLGLAFIPGMPSWAPPCATTLASTLLLPKIYQTAVLYADECRKKKDSTGGGGGSGSWFDFWKRPSQSDEPPKLEADLDGVIELEIASDEPLVRPSHP